MLLLQLCPKPCVQCVELTCPISSGFDVIDVQLWQTTRQQNWLSSICKLISCPDTLLPQGRRKLRIVWVKPAQKGLKLCFTCKASHAQDPAQTDQLPLDSSTRCASAKCVTCSVGAHKWNSNDRMQEVSPGIKLTSMWVQSEVQVQHSYHSCYGCAEHHNLANITLYSQSTAHATDKYSKLTWVAVLQTISKTKSRCSVLAERIPYKYGLQVRQIICQNESPCSLTKPANSTVTKPGVGPLSSRFAQVVFPKVAVELTMCISDEH